MEQIKVKKITANAGIVSERIMTLPKDLWERIVKNPCEKNVVYERIGAVKVTVKETELIPEKVSTKKAEPKEVIQEVSVNKYDNMSDSQIKDLAKSLKIKGFQVMSRETLIKKLSE